MMQVAAAQQLEAKVERDLEALKQHLSSQRETVEREAPCVELFLLPPVPVVSCNVSSVVRESACRAGKAGYQVCGSPL